MCGNAITNDAWMCYDCGYQCEEEQGSETIDTVADLTTDLLNRSMREQCCGVKYKITGENDFVMLIQVSNGVPTCYACGEKHKKFIVQRMYAKTPRIGTATKVIRELCLQTNKVPGVWIQQTLTDASRTFCEKIGATQHKYCDLNYDICSSIYSQ